jgi:ABC-type uncharacterized transport system auxiliary subunit
MVRRANFPAVVLLLLAVLGGCTSKRPGPVVVHVLRDLRSPYGSEVDRKILDFQGTNPKLSSGRSIVVQSETGDYKDMLQKQTSSSEAVDVILLNSLDDVQSNAALQIASTKAVDICAGVKACPANVPAIIPPQINGPEREAAQAFVDFLQKAS